MNKPNPLDKYTRHEVDRSVIVIPVVSNMSGGFIYKLTKAESKALDDAIANGSILLSVSPAGAVYSTAMPEKLPDMFSTFTADPECVTIHFVGDEMRVTLQYRYNSAQTNRLMHFIRSRIDDINQINAIDSIHDVTRLGITFKTSNAYAPHTPMYKRVKALATMYAQRITPRPEPKLIANAAQMSLF